MAKQNELREQVGQVLTLGFEPAEMSPSVRTLLQRLQPGGVILFARNIVSAEQTHRLLAECQAKVAFPLFRAVDMEGGLVDRFRNLLGRTPAPADVFASGNRKLFRKHGRIIGAACRALNFNLDFAPVLDLALEASRSVMRSRAVSADPRQVVTYARKFLAGLQTAGVAGCGKHFPGLGEANLDTHHELPNVAKPWKKLWDQDIQPYRTLRRELPMILIGHAAYPAVTRDSTPASLSRKWITDVLRKKIGYRGLVVSDDMEMGGVLAAGSIEEVAVGFLRAGGDLCLICRQEELVVRGYEALLREAERDARFRRRLAESARRVLAYKKKHKNLFRRIAPPTQATVEKLSRNLWEFSEQVRLATIGREGAA
jgi:beta-N-acetylhexosaminidase